MFDKKLNVRTLAIPLGDLIPVALMFFSILLTLFLSSTPKGVGSPFVVFGWPLIGLTAFYFCTTWTRAIVLFLAFVLLMVPLFRVSMALEEAFMAAETLPLVLALEKYKTQMKTYPNHIADLKTTSQDFDVSKYLKYDHEGILNQELYTKNQAGAYLLTRPGMFLEQCRLLIGESENGYLCED